MTEETFQSLVIGTLGDIKVAFEEACEVAIIAPAYYKKIKHLRKESNA